MEWDCDRITRQTGFLGRPWVGALVRRRMSKLHAARLASSPAMVQWRYHLTSAVIAATWAPSSAGISVRSVTRKSSARGSPAPM
ncbi:hypothetical protein BFL35_10700 [Clavibacter michiganensis]|nr:hypothetical protein BFL35_10700 [Clavibacter michiganensis]